MIKIDREKLPAVIFIAFTSMSLGAIASTIDSTVGREGGRPDVYMEPRQIGGDAGTNGEQIDVDQTEATGNAAQQTIDLVVCIDWLNTLPGMATVLFLVGALLIGIYRRYNAATSLLAGSVVIPITWGMYFFLTNCMDPEAADHRDSLFSGTDVVTGEGIGSPAESLPPEVAAVLFGLVLVGGIALMITMSGREESYETIEDDPEGEPDAAAFARAAGRAADRIEEMNVSVDNAVYRAWLEMTHILDLQETQSTTPRDFADAAIEIGLDEEDINELTTLFNEVRYANRSAEPREDRAIEILRHIEDTYERTDGESGES